MSNLLQPQEKLARLLAQGQLSDTTAERMLAVLKRRQSSEPLPQLFNQRQGAQFIGVSEQSLRRWNRDGIIPHVQIGKSKWYRPGDLQQAIEARVTRERA